MILRYLLTPFLEKKVRILNDQIGKIGPQAFFKKILAKHSTTLIVDMSDSTKEVLLQKPVLLIGNHPFLLEPIAVLATLPEREDIFLIVYDYFVGISENLDKYLIPVYINHHLNFSKMGLTGYLFKEFERRSNKSAEDEHKENIKSIQLAINKIADGGLVLMFPSPGKIKHSSKWFKGIGYLVKHSIASKNSYIVYVHTRNTSKFDLLRLFPLVGKLLPKIYLNYSSAIKLGNLPLKNSNAEQITSFLEQNYKEWTLSL